MHPGTANARLRKILLFDLIKKLNLDTCYRCGNKIEIISELTIDHKIDWLHKENAIDLFFDPDNIMFSHHRCNSAFTSQRKYNTPEERRNAANLKKKEYRIRDREKLKLKRHEKYLKNGT